MYYLPRIKPRVYSISSSPDIDNTKLSITFSLAKYFTPQPYNKTIFGQCTKWIESKILNSVIPISIIKGVSFPQLNLTQPLICIATGTGIAPIRSFLLQRKSMILDKKLTPNVCWVFYGCRTRNEYLYSEELESMVTSGIITKLIIAFSQEEQKIYVQNKIYEYGQQLILLMLVNHGYINICGLTAMAIPLKQIWIQLLKEQANMHNELASLTLKDWEITQRYNSEVWS